MEDMDLDFDQNEMRAKELAERFGYRFDEALRPEIRALLEQELADYQPGSSEYLRFLCGYLYCIGNLGDAELIRKVKYGINMDVGCMVDGEWLDSLENDSSEEDSVRSREELTADFVDYYTSYFK